jgi:hypothetical protein
VFALAVVVGGPLFLRMPLWIDVTLYDVAARNILSGGTHYRDVFDTNPPGFTWLLCLIRPLVGPSIEALRAVDLLVVGGIGWLLLRAARRAGATPAGVAWGAAGMTGFYLFVSEFNHVQRDTWMMLPALLATTYRLRRQAAARAGVTSAGRVFLTGAVEGLVWGVGVWIKPHVFPVAVAVWAALLMRWDTAAGPRLRRRQWADVGGVLLGGLAAGAAGVGWLAVTGTWEHFIEVFTRWNNAYLAQTFDQFGSRITWELIYFPPWSLLLLLAVPVAVLNILDARPWRVAGADDGDGPVSRHLPRWLYAPPADPDARATSAVLAVLYLAWVTTALVLQRQFHYVHVPETLLMIAVLAANRWAATVVALAAQATVIIWLAVRPPLPPLPPWAHLEADLRHVVWTYPDRDPNRLRWWRACLAPCVSGDVRNGVAFQSDYFSGTDTAGLEEVAAFLRANGIQDGELLAFNDSPHVLYLMLGIKPGIKFLHFSTAPAMGPDQYDWVHAEVEQRLTDPNRPPIRYVVSDLRRLSVFASPAEQGRYDEPGPSPTDLLPSVVDAETRQYFPYDQPTVFRSGNGRGRYVVHVPSRRPIGPIYSPE